MCKQCLGLPVGQAGQVLSEGAVAAPAGEQAPAQEAAQAAEKLLEMHFWKRVFSLHVYEKQWEAVIAAEGLRAISALGVF